MKLSLSKFSYFCPVSFKTEKSFKHSSHLPELCILYKHQFYYFSSPKEREVFLKNPSQFVEKVFFSSEKRTPTLLRSWKASELISNEKELQGYCPVSLKDEERMEQGNQVLIVKFDNKNFVFANTEKARKFVTYPHRYFKTQLPVKMPPKKESVGLYQLSKQEKSITFLEQALGSCVTKGLREVGESRLKYPTLSIKETSLKLFALFLKCENPANTAYMKQKYMQRCQDFLEICTISEELFELADEKGKRPFLNSIYLFVTFREEAIEGQMALVQRGLLQRVRS
jgi:adenylate/nucleoside-diphosphate kinase